MSKFALNISEDGRILSATFEEFAAKGDPLVDTLPEGDISEYRYVDGAYIHDPIPEPEVEPPSVHVSTDDVLNTLLGVTE